MKEDVHISDQELLCQDLSQTEQRALLVHLLYALESFDYDASLNAIVDNFARGFGVVISKESDVYKKADAIIREREELDTLIVPLIANWRIDRLGVVTRLILRISLWELRHTTLDKSVVINEAIELAKCFAEKDAYKFINGVLDEYCKREACSP